MPTTTGTTRTTGQGKRNRPRSGVVSGYVFRLIRERLDLTQEGLAERFGVAADTVAGWESGRRPLTAVPAGQMLVHRHRLLRLGTTPALLLALERAMEADVLLASALEDQAPTPEADPFGAWVMQRDLVEVLAWPLSSQPPEFVRALPPAPRSRRGPVAAGPELPATARAQFFDRMRSTAERARTPDHFLLRRQALYLSGYDRREDAAEWLAHQQQATRGGSWLTDWLTARSVASVATRHGDRERLEHFVRSHVGDDQAEAANLNYWAYWVGEAPTIEATDHFMGAGRPGAWGGSKLLDHLITRLAPHHGYADLYVHTLWALLAARPGLLRTGAPPHLRDRLEVMLDSREVSAPARRELDSIRYAIRLAEA
ncbi:helix-turn-helix domain-containing protein [Streptomyces sp. PTM05]|uniref:Helix-turn-helix domain-containing protein n=1 Tax=Streptantibioticus parmotrematis TaxID=2873249 RepID=A0ABS7QTL3_9ACTN|nr:helix-turn-helix domain-containing protein [Streptantibioticus parmotrematis]MBY8885167.1 helix-turn-helix domain-containing protein [Streptantibioticus parmotrematis]